MIAYEVDPSWLDRVPAALRHWAQASPLGLRLLSALLAREHALHAELPLELSPEQHWLLDGATRVRALAHAVGSFALASRARLAVERAHVQCWVRALAPHFDAVVQSPESVLRELPPQPDTTDASALRVFVTRLGHAVLAQLTPAPLTARLDLWFPREFAQHRVLTPNMLDLEAAGRLVRRLTTELPS